MSQVDQEHATQPQADSTVVDLPAIKPDATGLPYEIAGHTWLLPDFVPTFAAVWDAIFDQNALSGQYDPGDLRACAVRLILTNYTITPDDAVDIVWACDLSELVPPVETALFGPEKVHRTWSSWVESSLIANGLDPSRIPASAVRDVLEQLVHTGRAVPAEKWVSSAEYRAFRSSLDEIEQAP